MADPVTIALVAGTALSAGGALMQGRQAEKSAQFEAKQMDRNAMAAEATSQREAIEARRQIELQQSRARAVAAASGGTATDPGVTEIMSQLDREGELAALGALYEGRQQATSLRTGAAGRRAEGKAAKRASFISAGATALTGGASAAGRMPTGGGSKDAYKTVNSSYNTRNPRANAL